MYMKSIDLENYFDTNPRLRLDEMWGWKIIEELERNWWIANGVLERVHGERYWIGWERLVHWLVEREEYWTIVELERRVVFLEVSDDVLWREKIAMAKLGWDFWISE